MFIGKLSNQYVNVYKRVLEIGLKIYKDSNKFDLKGTSIWAPQRLRLKLITIQKNPIMLIK